ncbi:MAG: diguanylate cyclase [Clostridia bacterium]|jgi:diguanylate cyclase (GGDEF)-like protein
MKNLKKIILITIIAIVLVISFYRQFNIQITDIENTAKAKQAEIDRYADMSKVYIDLMTIYGNDYFEHGKVEDSIYLKYLKYNPASDSYNLDALIGTKYQLKSGSLTGLGKIPQKGIIRDELNLALKFFKQFDDIYKKLPNVTWIYYTSQNNFINMYPWVSSAEFSFAKDLKSEKFFTVATPKNDPLRTSIWTPVYLDRAGKGLMVSLSSPIYDRDVFKGVVSIDLTNDQLSEILTSEYESYIIDTEDMVIADSLNLLFYDKVAEFKTTIRSTDSYVQSLKELKTNQIERVGGYYIYTSDFHNATWKMIFRVPVWLIIGRSALFTLPIFVICILLFLTLLESERRKSTEMMLKKSLEELNSYQGLLENAAKYDFLTCSANRRGLQAVFDDNANSDNKEKCSIILIIGDIDFFKSLNDSYGHEVGDKVLVEVANIMQKNISENDVVCRWGGEEFVIMLLNRTCVEAMHIAENIRKQIETKVFTWGNSIEVRTTMTFGVAEHVADDDLQITVAKADCAMYYGKQHGRNCVVNHINCK